MSRLSSKEKTIKLDLLKGCIARVSISDDIEEIERMLQGAKDLLDEIAKDSIERCIEEALDEILH